MLPVSGIASCLKANIPYAFNAFTSICMTKRITRARPRHLKAFGVQCAVCGESSVKVRVFG